MCSNLVQLKVLPVSVFHHVPPKNQLRSLAESLLGLLRSEASWHSGAHAKSSSDSELQLSRCAMLCPVKSPVFLAVARHQAWLVFAEAILS